MNKLFLVFAILSAGTAGFRSARQSTNELLREANAIHESWIAQTRGLASAQSEVTRVAERIRELKQNLSQAEAVGNQNRLWSVLETNRTEDLPPDLREHLLAELGFDWNSSDDFIVVSKETVRDIHMAAIAWPDHSDPWRARLSDSAVAVLALTPQERAQIETSMERVKTAYKDWVISHTERGEPRDNVLAQYTVEGVPATNLNTITNDFFTELSGGIGKQRSDLIVPDAGPWIGSFGISTEPTTMVIKRFSEGDQQLVKFQERDGGPWAEISNFRHYFPGAFRPLFPNGWADIAAREGFELPEGLHK